MVLLALLVCEQPLHDAEDRPCGHPRDRNRGEGRAEVLDHQIGVVLEQCPGKAREVREFLPEVPARNTDVHVADAVFDPRSAAPVAGTDDGDVERFGQSSVDLVGTDRSSAGPGSTGILVAEMEHPRPDRAGRTARGARDAGQAPETEGARAGGRPERPDQEVMAEENQREAPEDHSRARAPHPAQRPGPRPMDLPRQTGRDHRGTEPDRDRQTDDPMELQTEHVERGGERHSERQQRRRAPEDPGRLEVGGGQVHHPHDQACQRRPGEDRAHVPISAQERASRRPTPEGWPRRG